MHNLVVSEHIVVVVDGDGDGDGGQGVAHEGGTLELTLHIVPALEAVGLDRLLDRQQPVLQLLEDVHFLRLELIDIN